MPCPVGPNPGTVAGLTVEVLVDSRPIIPRQAHVPVSLRFTNTGTSGLEVTVDSTSLGLSGVTSRPLQNIALLPPVNGVATIGFDVAAGDLPMGNRLTFAPRVAVRSGSSCTTVTPGSSVMLNVVAVPSISSSTMVGTVTGACSVTGYSITGDTGLDVDIVPRFRNASGSWVPALAGPAPAQSTGRTGLHHVPLDGMQRNFVWNIQAERDLPAETPYELRLDMRVNGTDIDGQQMSVRPGNGRCAIDFKGTHQISRTSLDMRAMVLDEVTTEGWPEILTLLQGQRVQLHVGIGGDRYIAQEIAVPDAGFPAVLNVTTSQVALMSKVVWPVSSGVFERVYAATTPFGFVVFRVEKNGSSTVMRALGREVMSTTEPLSITRVHVERTANDQILFTTRGNSFARIAFPAGNANGTTIYATPVETNAIVSSAVGVDLDSDGLDELVVLSQLGTAFVYSVTTSGGTPLIRKVDTAMLPAGAGEWRILTPVDVDGDNRLDVAAVAINPNTSAITTVVLHNRGNGRIDVDTLTGFEAGSTMASGALRAVAGDFNGDGRADIAVSLSGAPNKRIRYFDNVTGGTTAIDATEPLLQLAACDVDNNGISDLVGIAEDPMVNEVLVSHRIRVSSSSGTPSVDNPLLVTLGTVIQDAVVVGGTTPALLMRTTTPSVLYTRNPFSGPVSTLAIPMSTRAPTSMARATIGTNEVVLFPYAGTDMTNTGIVAAQFDSLNQWSGVSDKPGIGGINAARPLAPRELPATTLHLPQQPANQMTAMTAWGSMSSVGYPPLNGIYDVNPVSSFNRVYQAGAVEPLDPGIQIPVIAHKETAAGASSSEVGVSVVFDRGDTSAIVAIPNQVGNGTAVNVVSNVVIWGGYTSGSFAPILRLVRPTIDGSGMTVSVPTGYERALDIPRQPFFVGAYDLDRDLNTDALVGTDRQVLVLHSDAMSPDALKLADEVQLRLPGASSTRDVLAADLSGDGRADLIVFRVIESVPTLVVFEGL